MAARPALAFPGDDARAVEDGVLSDAGTDEVASTGSGAGTHPTSGREDAGRPVVASDVAAQRVERIALTYLLVASAWIVVSGVVAAWIAARTAIPVALLEAGKGLGFVVVTAAVLHRSLRRWSTRLRTATRAEREATERMRRAEDMRRTFLTGVSHELRTPLTAIVGYAQTIHRSGQQLAPEVLEGIADRLVVNTERLQAMVVDLLEVDRLLQGLGALHAEPVDLAELVSHLVASIEDEGRSGDGVGSPIEVVGEPVPVHVDVAKVERMLQHAIHNAIHHGGGVTAITVRVRHEAAVARICIEDDGRGFPEALLGRLFDPFVQDAAAAQRPSPGLGIGLTLVAQFAALHGGSAVAENRVTGGARLTIDLPLPSGDAR